MPATKRQPLTTLVAAALLAASCAPRPGDPERVPTSNRGKDRPMPEDATRIRVEPGPGPFRIAETEVMESQPVQFAVVLEKDYPSGGWEVELSGVERPKPGTIVVRIVERPPDGPAPLMIEAHRVRVPLGSIQVGRYRLEIHCAASPGGPFTELQAMALEAER